MEDAPAEGPAPAPAPVPAPAPAPAPTLEIVQEQPHTPGTRKSTENFGRSASAYSDFYIQTLSQPGLADTQYNVGLLRTFVNKLLAIVNTLFSYIVSIVCTQIHTYIEL